MVEEVDSCKVPAAEVILGARVRGTTMSRTMGLRMIVAAGDSWHHLSAVLYDFDGGDGDDGAGFENDRASGQRLLESEGISNTLLAKPPGYLRTDNAQSRARWWKQPRTRGKVAVLCRQDTARRQHSHPPSQTHPSLHHHPPTADRNFVLCG